MLTKEAIDHFGSRAALARAIGISRQSLTFWKKRHVPLGSAIRIEAVTNGALKVDLADYPQPSQRKAKKLRSHRAG